MKIEEAPVRWYIICIRGGEKIEVDENTAEAVIKAEKHLVLRDKEGRLVRMINKVDIADMYWDKPITKEKFLQSSEGMKLIEDQKKLLEG